MAAKLAISFLTYNRQKHIQEDLHYIALPTKEKGIDIYIFDGSTNTATQVVVNRYINMGYDHIHYFHYPDDKENHERRVKDALFLPDADYIWLCGDKFIVKPQNYISILKYIEEAYDIIVIYTKSLKGTKKFNDPVRFVEYAIVPLTYWGASIINKNLIEKYNFRKIREHSISFGIMYMYILAISKSDFKGVTICPEEKDFVFKSRYHTPSASSTSGRLWEVWIKDWYHVIMSLPDRYNPIKTTLLKKVDREMKFFGGLDLIRQRAEGYFDWKRVVEYRKYIKKVLVQNFVIVFAISLLPKQVAKVLYRFLNASICQNIKKQGLKVKSLFMP